MSITTNKYIGPIVPLVRNSKFGDFALTSDYVIEVKQNLKNIVLTEPGERMMDKDFGLGIKRYLFENKRSSSMSDLKSKLIDQCSRYLPVVQIDDVIVDFNMTNPNALGVKIMYSIPDLNVEDVLETYFK